MRSKELVLHNVSIEERNKVFKVADALGISIYGDTKSNAYYLDYPNLAFNPNSTSSIITETCSAPDSTNKSYLEFTEDILYFVHELVDFSWNEKFTVKLNSQHTAEYIKGSPVIKVGCQTFEKERILELADIIRL